MEELKNRIYDTAVEYNNKQKLARDLSEKRSEYRSLLANQEAKIKIVEAEIEKLDKQGRELTRQLEQNILSVEVE
jgi:hypothetical protein